MLRVMRLKSCTLMLLAFVLGFTACSTSTDGTSSVDTGTVTFSLTDAASDELDVFTVDLTGITLLRANGATTSVLSEPVDDVDLLQLQDLGDVVSVVDLPPAVYVGMTLTFDFTDAQACIIGQASAATITDSEGNVLTGSVSIDVTFGEDEQLSIIAGRHSLVELDFDLDASVTVDAGTNTVAVAPTIVMSIDPSDPKSLVLIGALVEVVDNGTETGFQMQLKRPGRDAIKTVNCDTNSATVFQIDGQSYVGAAGLDALGDLSAGSRIQCYGEVDRLEEDFNVEYVEAGIGALGTSDVVHGHVIARTGAAGADPVLTVRGFSRDQDGTHLHLNTDFTVNLSLTNTSVVKRADTTAYSSDDINVGQQVRIFGTLTGTTMAADTTDDLVRLVPTTVSGASNGVPASGVLDMDITYIGRRPIAVFDFVVATVAQLDSDAALIDIGGLGTSGITTSTPVQVRGFFEPVGSTANTDFEASSLSNFDNVAKGLRVLYLPAKADVLTPSASSLVLDISEAENAKLDTPFIGSEDLPLTPSPTIVPNTSALVEVYMIFQGFSVEIFTDFEEFSAALEERQTAGDRVLRVHAAGTYDDATNTMTSAFCTVRFVQS